ncbi:MAG: hypothetical protein IJU76_07580 [Desulfovibrionaceae bacterium]|nr:hypothetical protein [Desulfovibrionaceae bacterium]
MGIPKEILETPRPKNTIVVAYGKNRDRYAVRERIGCHYKNGRRLPITGKTVGHIIDGKYVPKNSNTAQSETKNYIDVKDWANVILCVNSTEFLLKDLLHFYNVNDAIRMYCLSILRVCYPGAEDGELNDLYSECFLSELYPNIDMSKNALSVFLNNLGRAYSKICKFMQLRVDRVEKDHHVIVAGSVKTDTSELNPFSEFSRKYEEDDSKKLSILYAYDLEQEEPICCQCFPEDEIDTAAYENFIIQNAIKKAIFVDDECFLLSTVQQNTKNKEFYYVNCIDYKNIDKYDIINFTEQLPGNKNISCKKIKIKNKYLYAFKYDSGLQSEGLRWLSRDNYNEDKGKQSFGIEVFESNLDTDISIIYNILNTQCAMEVLMRYYNQTPDFNTRKTHDYYSVIGSEFCNFLSTIITYKLLSLFKSTKLLRSCTYNEIMKILQRSKKVKIDKQGWKPIKLAPSQEKILEKLNLLSQFMQYTLTS